MYRHGYDPKPLGQQFREFVNTVSDQLNRLTEGQKNALLKTGLATGLIIGGSLTLPEGAIYIAAGIPILAEGLTLNIVEFGFHGDTSKIPSTWEVFGTIAEHVYNLNNPCPERN